MVDLCHRACSAKQLVAKYPAMCVAAWAYITAAVAMGGTALLFVARRDWEVPRQLLGPLAYWIFVCSVVGYYVVTWATQHLPASQARAPASGLGVFFRKVCYGKAFASARSHQCAAAATSHACASAAHAACGAPPL